MSEFDEWYEKETLNGWVNKDRIDGALSHLDLSYPESWGCCVEQTIDILKGNKDEKAI